MKIKVVLTALLGLFIFLSVKSQNGLTVLKDVNLITMESNKVLPNQTVVIKNEKILSIGNSEEVIITDSAIVIEGNGMFLLPGLTDSHMHLDKYIGARPGFGDAPLFLAHGVTTVFNLRGEPEHVDIKHQIEEGNLVAPNLYNSGEFVNEPRVNTPEEAKNEVLSQKNAGYDIIKYREVVDFENHEVLTTEGMKKDAHLALVKAAKKSEMPLVGHAPYKVGLKGMLEAGHSLAHMNELSNLYFLPPMMSLTEDTSVKSAILSLLLTVGVVFIWLIIRLVVRLRRGVEGRDNIHLRRFRIWISVIVLAAATSFPLWLVVTPPGLYFDSLFLLIVLSLLSISILIIQLFQLYRIIKIWQAKSIHAIAKVLTVLLLLITIGISVPLAKWVPFSWRGSDMVINKVAKDCKEAGIYMQTTLICQEAFLSQKPGFYRNEIVEDPTFKYLSAPMQQMWKGFAEAPLPPNIKWFRRLTDFNQKLTGALYKAGVPIMAGTDAMGAPLLVPGSSLHKELQLISESGLSNYEVLKTATINPAKFMNKEDEFGTISIGKRADLILVDGNPLEDLTVLKNPKGVMVRGTWLSEKKLQENLDAITDNVQEDKE